MLALSTLEPIAREAMESRGLAVDFPPEVTDEVARLGGPVSVEGVRDLRHLDWASIDNEDTRDIDQLAFVEEAGDGRMRLLVAIADVAEAVAPGSALDLHCQRNTVTVYTPGCVHPMLPLELSTDWTSLNPFVDRRAVVTEILVDADGSVLATEVFEAAVHNRAKLDYVGVSRADHAPDSQIGRQLAVGRLLAGGAARRGALAFEAERVMAVIRDGFVVGLVQEEKNVANEAVAQMMIAANAAAARFLHERGFPVLLRAMPPPERWDRLRQLAPALPEEPSAPALAAWLRSEADRDPAGYAEVSLSVLKLVGASDYVVAAPGEALAGHFAQNVEGYCHSTAPNRRYPDVLVQRLVKAALRGLGSPYSAEELAALAERCNLMESKARGAERQARKAAVSGYLVTQIGQRYPALVTGESAKGTFVRVVAPPLEGKLVEGAEDLDVGDRVEVVLRAVDPLHGHIDFIRA